MRGRRQHPDMESIDIFKGQSIASRKMSTYAHVLLQLQSYERKVIVIEVKDQPEEVTVFLAVFLQIQMRWGHLIAVREIVSVSLFTYFLIRPRRLHTPVVLLATNPLAPTLTVKTNSFHILPSRMFSARLSYSISSCKE